MAQENADGQRVPRFNDAAFSYYEPLGRVRDYVESNLSNSVTLSEAAGVACMSRAHFSVFFHRAVGATFMEWLRYVQVTKAARALRERDRLIWQVADSTGFRTVRTFERAFKQWIGMTPHQYKLQHRPEARF